MRNSSFGPRRTVWQARPRRARRLKLEPLEPRWLLDADVPVITEFMAINDGTLADGHGAYEDWIEIYNPTDAPVDLDGWYLTDKDDDLDKWPFPQYTLGSGDYLVVFASGQDVDDHVDPGRNLHANFKLDGDGENVALVMPDRRTAAYAYWDYPQQIAGVSYGFHLGTSWSTLVGSGATLSYHVPTPGDAALVPIPDVSPGWTATDFDDSSWTDSMPIGEAGLLITEIDAGDTKLVEIQNVSTRAIDTRGWSVLVNDAALGEIGAVDDTAWGLPDSVAPGQVLYRTDDPQDGYFGSEIRWADDGPGWVMILNETGKVMDFLAWGYPQDRIDSLSIDYGPLTGITLGGQWYGDGAISGGEQVAYAAEVLADNPELYYRFEESNRALPAGDSANNHDGLYRGDATPGQASAYPVLGGAVRFDGDGDYIDVNDTIITDDLTVETWVYADDFNNWDVLVNHDGWNSGDVHFQFSADLQFTINGNGGDQHFNYGFGEQRWYHVAVTYGKTDGELKLYVDGELQETRSYGNNYSPRVGPGWIGGWNNSRWFDGYLDEFAVYGTVLDGERIRAHYDAAAAGTLGTVLQRSGDLDTDSAVDFTRGIEATKGTENPDLRVPFGEIIPTISGIGFSDNQPDFDAIIATDVGEAMQDVNASLWTRFEFSAGDLSAFDALSLAMKYDDGFVAYLNGSEVARSNAPDALSYDSAAPVGRPNAQAVVSEDTDLSDHLGVLRPGTNVLAIHGLNVGPADADFLVQPKLISSGELSPPRFFGRPTPGRVNDPSLGAPAEGVSFSRPSGPFTEPSITVELDADTDGAVIHYTLDGSRPTQASPVYSDPLTITTTTQVRAQAYRPRELPGAICSESYIKLAGSLQSYRSDLPVLVIDTFGGGGIPAGSFEASFIGLFDRQESGWIDFAAGMDLATRAGIKTRGSSTSGQSYSFEAWGEQDEDRDVALLGLPEDSDFILYRSTFDESLMNNSFIFELSNQIGQYATRTRFVDVFLNTGGGEVSSSDHRGVYVLMEKIKRGSDRVDVQRLDPTDNAEPEITGGYMLKVDRQDPGDSGFHTSRLTPTFYGYLCYVYPKEDSLTASQKAWIRNWFEEFEDALYGPNFTDEELGYAAYIDVDAFIDHHVLNELAKNPDAFWLSAYMYKPREGKLGMGPIWDFDRALGFENRSVDPQGYVSFQGVQLCFNYDWWGRLFQDPGFMQKYVDRWQELRRDELSVANLHAIVDAQVAELERSQAGNSAWRGNVNQLKSWLADRVAWIDSEFVAPVEFSQDGGVIGPGFELQMDAPDGTVYYTLDGTDPRLPGGQPSPDATVYSSSGKIETTMVSRGSLWKYLDNGRNLGTPWREATFDDRTWASGEAQLGYGDGDEKTQVGFGPDQNQKYVTTYFRHTFQAEDVSDITALTAKLQCDDGAVVYLNGQEIGRPRMSGGTIAYDTYARDTVSGGEETVFTEIDVPDLSLLAEGENVLAVEVHQAAPNSSDISFDLELSATVDVGGTPGSAVALDATTVVTARAMVGNRWSGLRQAAFLANTPADKTNLAVTEIHYNPADPTLAELAAQAPQDEDFTSDDFEFIELMNLSGVTIDLAGVKFVEGITFDFTAHGVLTLGPQQRVAIVNNSAAFRTRYDSAGLLIAGEYQDQKQLSNTGERFAIQDAFGSSLVDFGYNDTGSWPGRADGKGASLELIHPAEVPTAQPQRTEYLEDGDHWRSSVAYGGTPGGDPAGPLGVVINEVLTHTDPPALDTIELHNTTDGPIDVGGWYLSDSWGWETNAANGNYRKFLIPADDPAQTTIPAHGYLLFDERNFNPNGAWNPAAGEPGENEFALDGAHGDDVWLMRADVSDELTHFADHVEFGAAARDESWGRWPNGQGLFYPMQSPTIGGENGPGPRLGSVIISEVHYHPDDPDDARDLEFIEIYNSTSAAVELPHWRIRKGIDFDFPAGTTLDGHSTIVLVPFDLDEEDKLANFHAAYDLDNQVRILGGYSGRLSNAGEKVQLQRPGEEPADEPGFFPGLLEDEIFYDDKAPWPVEADGVGSSLHRRAVRAWGDAPESWIAAEPTPGAAGFPIDHPGDANLDGVTDVRDFNIWNAHKFTSGTNWSTGDFNWDGRTDVRDFNIWNAHKFTSAPGPARVDAALQEADQQDGSQRLEPDLAKLAWLCELEGFWPAARPPDRESYPEAAVDRLLATYWQ